MEDKVIVRAKKDDDEDEADDVPLDEGVDRVAQSGKEAAEVDKGEDEVRRGPPAALSGRGSLGHPLYLTTWTERIVTGSSGTFWWLRLLPVGTLAMASTTSMPAMTLPKTQYPNPSGELSL